MRHGGGVGRGNSKVVRGVSARDIARAGLPSSVSARLTTRVVRMPFRRLSTKRGAKSRHVVRRYVSENCSAGVGRRRGVMSASDMGRGGRGRTWNGASAWHALQTQSRTTIVSTPLSPPGAFTCSSKSQDLPTGDDQRRNMQRAVCLMTKVPCNRDSPSCTRSQTS